MYISLWENSRGHPDNVSFMQFSMKIDGFEQKIHRALRTHTTLMNNTHVREIFHFHHLPKLYFGFKVLKKKNLKQHFNVGQHSQNSCCCLIAFRGSFPKQQCGLGEWKTISTFFRNPTLTTLKV